MVNTHKVSPERFRHLSQRITIATKLQDWSALARYDSELRELLQYHKPFLRDPQLAPQIVKAKAAHQAALAALKAATAELESDMVQVSAQQERALAYQLAMTMEG